MGKFVDFVKGALLGGLVGSVMAVLAAPESGKALQERLRGQARQVLDDAQKAAAARRAELEAELQSAQQQARRPEPPDGYYG